MHNANWDILRRAIWCQVRIKHKSRYIIHNMCARLNRRTRHGGLAGINRHGHREDRGKFVDLGRCAGNFLVNLDIVCTWARGLTAHINQICALILHQFAMTFSRLKCIKLTPIRKAIGGGI